jgi:hypothetical protein
MSSWLTGRAEPLRRGVRWQEPVAALLVGEAMAGDEDHADVAAGDGSVEPFERVEHVGAARVLVENSAHFDI